MAVTSAGSWLPESVNALATAWRSHSGSSTRPVTYCRYCEAKQS